MVPSHAINSLVRNAPPATIIFVLLVIASVSTQRQVTLAFVPSSPPFRILETNHNNNRHHHDVSSDSSAKKLPAMNRHRARASSIATTTTTLQVVVDPPEKEDVNKNRRNRSDDSVNNKNNVDNESNNNNDDSSSSWIPTKDGGFLPNLLNRNRNRRIAVAEVKTIEEYKSAVVDEKEQLVAVRFYAPWCKACRAIQSRFRKLASDYPHVKFVEMPVTESNAFLSEGLGVPALPYGHIYHPAAGLVDERSLNKKVFSDFKDVLKTYVEGECQIDWDAEVDEGK